MTKCPYVPPHPLNLDFPHLMLRHRAVQARKKGSGFVERQLGETDRNGKLANPPPARQLGDRRDQHADAPTMERSPASTRRACRATPARRSKTAGAARARARQSGRARLRPAQGGALRHLLRQLQQPRHRRGGARGAGQARRRDQGGLSGLLRHAPSSRRATSRRSRPARAAGRRRAAALDRRGLRRGRADAVCGLMMKFEWPLILPENPAVEAPVAGDARHQRIRRRPRQGEGLAPGLEPIEGGVTCTTPATPGRRTWAPRRPRCCG